MKSGHARNISIAIVAALLGIASTLVAQPAAGPLDIEGLDQFSITGVRSRAMGGTAVASVNDASALFSNPAALSRLTSLEVRVNGLMRSTIRRQSQEWVAFRSLPGLSVLFEGLTGSVKIPTDPLGNPLGPWETVQRQYDDIMPNWRKDFAGGGPLSLVAAMPLTLAGMDIAAGLGISQVIDLDQYYQNNNSMSPYLGQQRPDPDLITKPTDTLHIKWYQYIRSRSGSVYGVVPAVSAIILPGLRLGASATILTGSSDDMERRLERGHINIAIDVGEPQNFMLDTVYYSQSKVGTSKYRGNIFIFGLHFEQERYSIGVTIRPPMELTRSWTRSVSSVDSTRKSFPVRIDSMKTRRYEETGEEYIAFPLSYALGIVLTPTDKWTVAFDYELRQLSEVSVTSASNSTVSYPWINARGMMRLGAEYRTSDLLALRCGYREDIQAFSPDGSAILDEPARGGVYSLGAGFTFANVIGCSHIINIAYEYSRLKYADIYQSNASYNTQERHQFLMEIAYRF